MVRCLNLLSYSRSNTIQSLALSSGNWLWDFANYVTCRNPKLIFIGWPLEFFLNLMHEYYFVLTVVRLCIHNFANVPNLFDKRKQPIHRYPAEVRMLLLKPAQSPPLNTDLQTPLLIHLRELHCRQTVDHRVYQSNKPRNSTRAWQSRRSDCVLKLNVSA